MDVGSKNSYPAGKLSNFSAFQFEFEGVHCNSMEGLLQAFKFEKVQSQVATCQLVGFAAKKKAQVEILIGKKNKHCSLTVKLILENQKIINSY